MFNKYERQNKFSWESRHWIRQFKGTYSVISSDPPLKMAMLDSQRCPWSPYLINIVEDIVDFLDLWVCIADNPYKFSFSRNVQVTFLEKPQFTIISFQNDKYWYLIYTSSYKVFKCTFVNQAIEIISWDLFSFHVLSVQNVKKKY